MDFFEIDRRRREQERTVLEFCRAARVAPSTYWFIRTGRTKMIARTRRRFEAALVRGPGKVAPAAPLNPDLIRAAYRGWVAFLAAEHKLEPAAVLAQVPARRATANPAWAAAAKIREMAVYCVVVTLDMRMKQVAEAIGITRQAASEMLKRVEDRREDPALDALIEKAGALISGKDAA